MPLTPRQRACLDAMGIDVWVRRDQESSAEAVTEAVTSEPVAPPPVAPVSEPSPVEAPAETPTGDIATLDWTALEDRVAHCTRCELHATRTRPVFGVGNREARLMFVGEAPGAEEDRQGEPFVGRAGKLLDAMLEAIGRDRGNVYIANILKCRPPNNRDPSPEEAAACTPYLWRQIELVQPVLIVALGRIAAQRLLGTGTSLARLRGTVHTLEPTGTPLIVTYHPAYLLRSPGEKRKAWIDLKFARDFVARREAGA